LKIYITLKKKEMLLLLVSIFILLGILWTRRKREGFEDLHSFSGMLFFIKPVGCENCAKMRDAYTELVEMYPENVRIIDCTDNVAETCDAKDCTDRNAAANYMTLYKVNKNNLPVIKVMDNGTPETYVGDWSFIAFRDRLIEVLSQKKSADDYKRTTSYRS
jgi:hypothetical protein